MIKEDFKNGSILVVDKACYRLYRSVNVRPVVV